MPNQPSSIPCSFPIDSPSSPNPSVRVRRHRHNSGIVLRAASQPTSRKKPQRINKRQLCKNPPAFQCKPKSDTVVACESERGEPQSLGARPQKALVWGGCGTVRGVCAATPGAGGCHPHFLVCAKDSICFWLSAHHLRVVIAFGDRPLISRRLVSEYSKSAKARKLDYALKRERLPAERRLSFAVWHKVEFLDAEFGGWEMSHSWEVEAGAPETQKTGMMRFEHANLGPQVQVPLA